MSASADYPQKSSIAAGLGPPVAQSSSSTMWTTGTLTRWPICIAQPILPVAMTSASSRARLAALRRSEEHTSELQSLLRISYAVFCLKKKKATHRDTRQSEERQIQT